MRNNQSTHLMQNISAWTNQVMIRKFWILAICLLAFGATSASATSMHGPTITDPQAYIDLGAQFGATGFLAQQDSTGNNVSFASFTLIDQHWGVTAAHNFFDDDTITGNMFASTTAGFGSNRLDMGNPVFDVDAIFIHPEFTNIGVSPDIALIRFDTPISGITPAEIYTGELQVGDIVTSVGFGVPGDSSGNTLPTDGFKRGANNPVDRFGDIPFGISDDNVITQFSPVNFSNGNPLGGTATPGDSGGGLYFGDQLAGVLGFNISGFDYFSQTGSVLISSELDFITETQLNNPPVDVPEPGSLALLSMGSLLMLRRRKRA